LAHSEVTELLMCMQNLRPFFLYYFNNQRSYEQTKIMIEFSMSKRFKNHFDEDFNNSCESMYRSEKDVEQNFLL